jgi:thiol-disulfide isomerase/thioredoxin
MKNTRLCILFLLLPFFSFCQGRPFEVFGKISGSYYGKIYLFFEGNYRQRDSISSEIKNGAFYFKGEVAMPVQARLHMDQQSFIRDIYIANSRTYVRCTTKMNIFNKGQDTMNMLSVISVDGSTIDKIKSGFESGVEKLQNSKSPDEVKRETYFQKLSTFIKKHPKNKLSPYLLGKASSLSYSQVKALNSMIDTSLANSFETKSVRSLLNQLDKSQNSAIGVAFHDVIAQDSIDREVDTKQLRGKYTLIVCWASWCKPCRAEHPELNALYEKYKDKGVNLVGVSFDMDKLKWKQAIVKDGLHWMQVIDTHAFEGEMAKYYGIEAIPANFLLDKDGKILAVGLTTKEIEEKLSKEGL